MQIRIRFPAEGLSLPTAYQYAVQGMIYDALDTLPSYQALLHDRGYAGDGKRFKCFTFSRLTGRYRIENGRILFFGGCSLEIRSSDPLLIRLLTDAFAKGTVHRLGSSFVIVSACEPDDRHIVSDDVSIRMLSPVTVYRTGTDRHTDYANPAELRFYEWIRNNATQKWKSLMHTPLPGPLTAKPLAVSARDKVVTTYKGTRITGWMGSYHLTGPRQLLDLLYQIGIGAKNSQGFGMFEILPQHLGAAPHDIKAGRDHIS